MPLSCRARPEWTRTQLPRPREPTASPATEAGPGRDFRSCSRTFPEPSRHIRAPLARQRAGQLICYVRFMDDVVILAKSRWQLRRAIVQLHAVLRPLNLRLHRRKRFIGRVTVGFDFLGYRLHPGRKLRPSWESLRRLRMRARRLYEREADLGRLRQYVARWWRWLHGGLWGRVSRLGGIPRLTKHILAHLRINRPRGREG